MLLVLVQVCPPRTPGQLKIPVNCLAGLVLLSTGKLEAKLRLLWDTFAVFGAPSVDVQAVGTLCNHMLHCWYLRPPSAETIKAQATIHLTAAAHYAAASAVHYTAASAVHYAAARSHLHSKTMT